MDNYHADTSHISKSGLDLIARSPRHYWHKYLNPDAPPEAETPALIFGRLAHCAVFEPDELDARFAVAPDINRRTNAGKEAWAEFKAAAAGKTIISMADKDKARRINDAVRAHPAAAALLSAGVAEQAIYARHEETGSPVKCKPDWDHGGLLTDLKTTEDARPEAFGRSAWKWRYDVQAAFYLDTYMYGTETRPDGFVFIAVEKEPPYGVAVYYAERETIALGRERYMPDLEKYELCRRTGEWPGYSNKIETLSLPGYAFSQL